MEARIEVREMEEGVRGGREGARGWNLKDGDGRAGMDSGEFIGGRSWGGNVLGRCTDWEVGRGAPSSKAPPCPGCTC